ncbi:MAG: hypothetical protein U0670_04280 [Anaerolineae bacterium]
MRGTRTIRFFIGILLALFGLSVVFAQSPVNLTVFIDNDSLTVYVPTSGVVSAGWIRLSGADQWAGAHLDACKLSCFWAAAEHDPDPDLFSTAAGGNERSTSLKLPDKRDPDARTDRGGCLLV